MNPTTSFTQFLKNATQTAQAGLEVAAAKLSPIAEAARRGDNEKAKALAKSEAESLLSDAQALAGIVKDELAARSPELLDAAAKRFGEASAFLAKAAETAAASRDAGEEKIVRKLPTPVKPNDPWMPRTKPERNVVHAFEIAKGERAPYGHPAGNHVIKTWEELAALGFELISKNVWPQDPDPLKIEGEGGLRSHYDFDNDHMALAVIMGDKPSSGYSIAIEKVVREGDNLTVHVKKTAPQAGAFGLTVMTNPYHIVIVRKVNGEVKFVDAA